jgi:hypothetical protein
MSYVSPADSKLLYGTKPSVPADGEAFVAVKARLRNERGQFVAGRFVEFIADREGVIITQPAEPTGEDGLAVGYVRAVTPGPVNITALVHPEETEESSESSESVET